MNNRIISTVIGIGLIVALGLIIFNTKTTSRYKGIPEAKVVKELISADKLEEAKERLGQIAEKYPDMSIVGRLYFELAEAYEKKEELLKARDIYESILNNYQNVDNILEIQERLGKLNIQILFSPAITDEDILYEVEPGDTLSRIAKKFGTTIDLIKKSNSIEGDLIQAHSRLKVSKTRYKILIDKSQNLLTLLKDEGSIVKSYKVSTGENNSTPVGTFKIVNKIIDPVWYKEGAIVPAESPENILGSRWLGLSERGYGIHGTTDPASVGTQATKGCIRMLNADVEELYTIVPIGTEVIITD